MHQIWQDFLKIIKEDVGSQVVETWFKAVSISNWEEEKKEIHLDVPNQFVKSWLQEHYQHLISRHLSSLLKKEINYIEFSCPLTNNSNAIIAKLSMIL